MEIPDIQEERDCLEREAATALGFILFEMTRLDMELGLYLCWMDENLNAREYAEKINDMSFFKRLNLLEGKVVDKFNDKPEIARAYNDWIIGAHDLRELRNELFHGRWGFEADKQMVANVVGLPTSSSQKSRLFSIEELQAKQKAIQELRSKLNALGKLNPV